MNEQAKNEAIKVLGHCARSMGFFASGLPGGYEAVWARDSMITSLGASLIGEKFKDTFKKSIETLRNNQSALGQIPNAVGSYNDDRQSDVTFNSIDSSLWYLVGQHAYRTAYKDNSVLNESQESIEKAMLWLRYQDPNEDKLLAQQPTMDWQDAFPHKYGHVINAQALHYAILKMHGHDEPAEHIKKVVNGEIERYLMMYDEKRGYYLPWNWKNHDGDREQEEWFDALGNLLAIVCGLATPEIAGNILDYIEREAVNRPFPCRTMHPALKKGDKEWRSYFEKCDAREPYSYLNSGVWPFIGGFYIAALVKAGKIDKAKEELDKLTDAVKTGQKMEWEFNEWLHGQTGKPGENSAPYQGWTAGMYLFAYECVERGEVPYFTFQN
ncbi:MAG: hypothetical protein A2754_01835 [Candidatus Magasanikbacteria bacterium RIFCSPHIGHO2_01_FULL_47_8]|uniref:beta-fructofuranosidase n=1 Tax=Candidatus Magasanikbacteria bacterium RIFCSPHIGHO2_01_FULL_47_8 TaxID=1798673 RepID=A0A1F6MDH8_9BACT|nr:MAG: hypothetical protein A2754_01835 [Candidatus Magasanikbacteria bacterium RIFCSPHIGHO2_01_FULL_47_8]